MSKAQFATMGQISDGLETPSCRNLRSCPVHRRDGRLEMLSQWGLAPRRDVLVLTISVEIDLAGWAPQAAKQWIAAMLPPFVK